MIPIVTASSSVEAGGSDAVKPVKAAWRDGDGPHSAPTDSSNVTVGVRVRSFRPSESRELAVRMAGPTCQITSEERGSLKFSFDQCFWSCDISDPAVAYASQQSVYEALGKPIVRQLLDGYNCSLIAFGPTGSGKTYSLFGQQVNAIEAQGAILSDDDGDDVGVGTNASSPRSTKREEGLVLRVVDEILSSGRSRRQNKAPNGRVRSASGKAQPPPSPWKISRTTCTMVEVYLDSVFDLSTDDRKELMIRADPQKKTYSLPGATELDIKSAADFRQKLLEAERRKTVMSTAKNARSSRAHTIIQLSFEMEQEGQQAATESTAQGDSDDPSDPPRQIHRRIVRLGFADLAGSERVKEAKTEGLTMEQSRSINLSLLSLGKCVEAIARLGKDANPNDIMHFKDCSLTKLLKEYISGNSLTTLLVTIAPGLEEYHNSVHALRFGDRAKHITNHVAIQTNLPEAVQASNALLPSIANVGNSDMGLADGGNGGRVYLFRQTKEYQQAQWSIRVFSLQKREQHLRHAITSEEHSAFMALQRHVGKEISRAHANMLRNEIHKLPILMRLRRAMAVTEAVEGGGGGSAPPALSEHHSNSKMDLQRQQNQNPGTSSSAPVASLAIRAARWARLSAGKCANDAVTPRGSDAPPREAWGNGAAKRSDSNSTTNTNTRLAAHDGSDPSGKVFTPRPPNRSTANRPANRSASANDASEEGPAMPSLFQNRKVPPLQADGANDESKSKHSRKERSQSKEKAPPDPAQASTASPNATPRKQRVAAVVVAASPKIAISEPRPNAEPSASSASASPAVVSRLYPSRGATAVSPKPPTSPQPAPTDLGKHRKSIAADADLLRRDNNAARQQFLLAERQFNAEEFMKRIMIDTEQTSVWKKFLKEVVACVPDHGTAVVQQANAERKKSVASLLSRKSISGGALLRHGSISPPPISASPPSRIMSSLTSPSSGARQSPPGMSPTFVPEPITSSLSPTMSDDAVANSAKRDDHIVEHAGGNGWSLHAGGATRNRVQSARFRQARIGSIDEEEQTIRPSDVRVPSPPEGNRPPVYDRQQFLVTLEAVEKEEVADRLGLIEAEESIMRDIVAACAVHAALRIHGVVSHFLQRLQLESTRADDDEPPHILDHVPHPYIQQYVVDQTAQFERSPQKKDHERLLVDALRFVDGGVAASIHPKPSPWHQRISWTWLLQHLELCTRAAVWLTEDEAHQRQHRRLTKRRSSPYETACQAASSSLKDNMASIIFEIVRGVNVLRHLAISSSLPTPDLEASLEPERVVADDRELRAGSILLPSGTSGLLNHRLSFDGNGLRPRQHRMVSFSHEADYSDEDDGPHDEQQGIVEAQRTAAATTMKEALPNGSSPVESTPSDSPRSSPRSSGSTPSLSRSPTPVGSDALHHRDSNGSSGSVKTSSKQQSATTGETTDEVSPYDRIDYYPSMDGCSPSHLRRQYQLLEDVVRVEELQREIIRRNSSGVFTDEEQRHVSEREERVNSVKRSMIQNILAADTSVVINHGDGSSSEEEDEELVQRFEDFVNDLVLSTDINPVNLQLVRALLDAWRQQRIVPSRIDLRQLSENRGWIAAACVDGSIGYVRSLLNLYRVPPPPEGDSCSVPEEADVNLDFNEVCCSAMYNQLHRIPLVNTLLRYVTGKEAMEWYPALCRAFVDCAADMRHEWNEFLHDICNAKKILPKENRVKRFELVHRLIASRTALSIDLLDEGADDQTRFSRACRDGDAELLQELVDLLPQDAMEELLLRVQPDKTTALIQAVIHGSKSCVTILTHAMQDIIETSPTDGAQRVKVSILHASPDAGTALELCRMLKRDVSIEVDIEKVTKLVSRI